MSRGVSSCGVTSSRSATLGDTSEREARRVVPGGALSSALVQAFFLFFFADLDLSLAPASAGLIPPDTGLEQFRALRQGYRDSLDRGVEGWPVKVGRGVIDGHVNLVGALLPLIG